MDQPTPAPPSPAPPPRAGRSASGTLLRVLFVSVLSLVALGLAFFFGLGTGAVGALAMSGSAVGRPVVGEFYREGSDETVAVIEVRGVIDDYQAERVRALTDHVLDGSFAAVVLRVDSPGGAIAPSDRIWYEMTRLREAGLPLVASYGGVAASGGYYISCAADHIAAEPTCITGSIGVIAQTFILKDMLDKVGIEPVTVLSSNSPRKDLGNPFREWTEEDRQRFRDLLDDAYALFIERVAGGRADELDEAVTVDELADGSVYTADEALAHGLIDSIGYLDDAIAQAEQQAGLPAESATVRILREPISLLAELLGVSGPAPALRLRDADDLRSLADELATPRLMYLMR